MNRLSPTLAISRSHFEDSLDDPLSHMSPRAVIAYDGFARKTEIRHSFTQTSVCLLEGLEDISFLGQRGGCHVELSSVDITDDSEKLGGHLLMRSGKRGLVGCQYFLVSVYSGEPFGQLLSRVEKLKNRGVNRDGLMTLSYAGNRKLHCLELILYQIVLDEVANKHGDNDPD